MTWFHSFPEHHAISFEIHDIEDFFKLASEAAQASICVRSQVGAVLVDRFGVEQGTGHNFIPGWSNDGPCSQVCPRARANPISVQTGLTSYTDPVTRCPAVHAERAAIIDLQQRHRVTDLYHWTMFVTREPCYQCKPMLRAFGIVAVWPIEEKGKGQ